MKHTEHTCALWREKGQQRISDRSGGGSHWGEWSGGSMLSGTRGKATAVSRAGRENSETIPKR